MIIMKIPTIKDNLKEDQENKIDLDYDIESSSQDSTNEAHLKVIKK